MSVFDSSSVSFLKAFFFFAALTATSYLLMCYFPAWGTLLALPHICQVHVHLRAFAFTVPLPWLFHQLSSPPSTQPQLKCHQDTGTILAILRSCVLLQSLPVFAETLSIPSAHMSARH